MNQLSKVASKAAKEKLVQKSRRRKKQKFKLKFIAMKLPAKMHRKNTYKLIVQRRFTILHFHEYAAKKNRTKRFFSSIFFSFFFCVNHHRSDWWVINYDSFTQRLFLLSRADIPSALSGASECGGQQKKLFLQSCQMLNKNNFMRRTTRFRLSAAAAPPASKIIIKTNGDEIHLSQLGCSALSLCGPAVVRLKLFATHRNA